MLREMLLGVAIAATPAMAQEKKEAKGEKKAPTAQQERMADCNKQAASKKLKGDERKDFMSSCLKDKPQDRMAKCNKEAGSKALKGDERKKFMSECLKT
jgi:hypothetical protein